MSKTYISILAAVGMICVSQAYAANDYNCNGNNSCPNNSTTNNDNSITNSPIISPVNTNTATGGTATQGQGQLQGQLQGQAQNSTNTNRNDNTNANVNANSNSNRNDNSNSNSNSNRNDNRSTAVSGSSSSSRTGDQKNSQSTSVNVDAHQEAVKIPVATAYAPALSQGGNDTCMGSTSAGAQGAAFGVSFGSTWTDANCVRLKNARELGGMGFKAAAVALMCQNEDVAKAMADSGTSCVNSKSTKAEPTSFEESRGSYVLASQATPVYGAENPTIISRKNYGKR